MNNIILEALSDRAEIVRGVTFSKRDALNEYREGYLPVLRAGNIQSSLILDDDLVYVPRKMVSDRQRIRRGDIVMCTSSGSVDVVGKTAFSFDNWDGSFGAFCAVVRPKHNDCDSRYLYHYLQSPEFRHWTRNSSGINIKNIRKSELDNLKVPFPDIDVQRRIAVILDKADNIRRKRDDFHVLAEELVRSIFLDLFGHPLSPNSNLPTNSLGNLCDLFAGNSLPNGESFQGQEGGWLLLKVSDLNISGNEEVITTAKAWLPEGSSLRGFIVAPSQAIVFPKRGGAIATNKKRILGRPSILDPNLMAVAPKADSGLTFQYLRAWFGLLDLASISNGSSVPQLNKRDLAPLEMVVPRPEDLCVFEGVTTRISKMVVELRRDMADANALFSTLSQRAFRGDL